MSHKYWLKVGFNYFFFNQCLRNILRYPLKYVPKMVQIILLTLIYKELYYLYIIFQYKIHLSYINIHNIFHLNIFVPQYSPLYIYKSQGKIARFKNKQHDKT